MKQRDAEMIYVGFWTDKGTADQACLELLGRLRNKKIFLFGTAGFGGSEAYYQNILANVGGLRLQGGSIHKLPFPVRC